MPSPAPRRDSGELSVFINCPFDDDYKPLLRAICFATMACGYAPRCALDNNDSGLLRFPEIIRMLAACGRSIHDVSRVQLDRASRLPRFNMPLELGADFGLRFAGSTRQRRRKSLILDSEPHRYDQTLSDLSGMDIGSHGNDTQRIIGLVRDWLNANRVNDHSPLPGAVAINADHDAYLRLAPDIIANLRLDTHDDLPHGDYLHVVRVALPIIEKARATPAVN